MKKKTQKAMAAAKGRTVYYLTETEAEVIDRMRFEGQSAKLEAVRAAAPKCKYVWAYSSRSDKCVCIAKRDGYCLVHWKMLQRHDLLG